MTGITFIIRGEPIRVTQQQHRFGGHKANGKAIVYRDDRLASAYDWLCMEMRRQMAEAKNIHFRKINEGCTVFISWYFGTTTKRLQGRYKITRPDVDNLAKGILDALVRAGVIADDGLVARLELEKHWSSKAEARTIIAVY